MRWLAADELDDVDWLEPDRPFLAELARVLGIIEGVRGIFFDEDHARAVARRLTAEGYDAAVVRERLAGEDDDEDHPWAVLTDAPEMVLDLLVDEYDGWLDPDDGAGAGPGAARVPGAPPPLDLPSGAAAYALVAAGAAGPGAVPGGRGGALSVQLFRLWPGPGRSRGHCGNN